MKSGTIPPILRKEGIVGMRSKVQNTQANQDVQGIQDAQDVQVVGIRPISPDTISTARKELFSLIISMEETMRAFGVPSVQFVGDVLACKNEHEQLGYMIDALRDMQKSLEKTGEWKE